MRWTPAFRILQQQMNPRVPMPWVAENRLQEQDEFVDRRLRPPKRPLLQVPQSRRQVRSEFLASHPGTRPKLQLGKHGFPGAQRKDRARGLIVEAGNFINRDSKQGILRDLQLSQIHSQITLAVAKHPDAMLLPDPLYASRAHPMPPGQVSDVPVNAGVHQHLLHADGAAHARPIQAINHDALFGCFRNTILRPDTFQVPQPANPLLSKPLAPKNYARPG